MLAQKSKYGKGIILFGEEEKMKIKYQCIKCDSEYEREINFDKVSPKEFMEGIIPLYICLNHIMERKNLNNLTDISQKHMDGVKKGK